MVHCTRTLASRTQEMRFPLSPFKGQRCLVRIDPSKRFRTGGVLIEPPFAPPLKSEYATQDSQGLILAVSVR